MTPRREECLKQFDTPPQHSMECFKQFAGGLFSAHPYFQSHTGPSERPFAAPQNTRGRMIESSNGGPCRHVGG